MEQDCWVLLPLDSDLLPTLELQVYLPLLGLPRRVDHWQDLGP